MKKIYFLAFSLCISSAAFAQVFWTEDFGTGCNRGQVASAYTGTNGAWTIASTGTNGNVANTFYVSSTAAGTGSGNCSDNCIFNAVSNASLHVSNSSIVIPAFLTVNADTGGSYFTGGFSSFGYVATSNTRAESPMINCTGMSNIQISFNYFENGQAALDDATLVYSPDGGMTWTAVDALAKTTGCAAGQWTAFTATLPAGADNNASVKIGFAWTNNDDGQGSDPSFAVDDISLNSNPLGIANQSAVNVNLFAVGHMVQVETTQSWSLVSVSDIMGRSVDATRNGNQIILNEQAEGVYFVTINVNGAVLIRKVLLQ